MTDRTRVPPCLALDIREGPVAAFAMEAMNLLPEEGLVIHVRLPWGGGASVLVIAPHLSR